MNCVTQNLSLVWYPPFDKLRANGIGPKCRHYLRYVDDFILLHHDPAQLLVWRQAIADFLQTRMELVLKDLPEPRPVGDGANFLGYIVRPHYRLVRRRVVGNLRAKLDALARIAAPGSGIVCLDTAQRETLRATLASYLGHFRHARHHRLTAALWCRYPWPVSYTHLTLPTILRV